MDQEQTRQQRARELIRLLVPQGRPTPWQVLWAIRITIVLGVLIAIGYNYGITLWDWAQLLIIPAVIAAGGVWFNRQQRERELEIAERQRQEEALQGYLDRLSQLLTDKDRPLRKSAPWDNLSTVARAQTIAVLPRLNPRGKGNVLQFLHDTNLILTPNPIINIEDTHLRDADLHLAILTKAHLAYVDLSGANLQLANLNHAWLAGATLTGADLTDAFLSGTDLRQADLNRAELTGATLQGSHLLLANLKGASLKKAHLSGSNLGSADLSGADLGEAIASGIELEGANLRGANLRNAYLIGTNLRYAKLQGADLSGANLENAILSGANLARTVLTEATLDRTALREPRPLLRKTIPPTDLREVVGLTQQQIELAIGDETIILPPHLRRPQHWESSTNDNQRTENR